MGKYVTGAIIIALLTIIGALALYIINRASVNIAQLIQILVTCALAFITLAYVMRTAEIAEATAQQAEASVKMAKEMENQRYSTVRPVIDIEVKPLSNMELTKQAYTKAGELQLPKTLLCKLRNIGLGPAIDTYSFILLDNDNPVRQKHGVLKVQDELPKVSLCLEQRDEDWFLVVYYRDIYGRSFESTREIIISQKANAFTFGRFDTSRLKKDE